MLKPEQRAIAMEVIATLYRWLECDDLSTYTFQLLRLSVNGPGGSGKSVVINVIVSIMRVVAPIGTAAFNVRGDTSIILLGWKKVIRSTLQDSWTKANGLILLPSLKLKRSWHYQASHCWNYLWESAHEWKSFGGLPIVVVVEDDYQLSGIKDGGLNILSKEEALISHSTW